MGRAFSSMVMDANTRGPSSTIKKKATVSSHGRMVASLTACGATAYSTARERTKTHKEKCERASGRTAAASDKKNSEEAAAAAAAAS